MTTAILYLTLIMLVRLGLPERQLSAGRSLVLTTLYSIMILLCFELNLSAMLFIFLIILTHVLSEHVIQTSWHSLVRVITLIDFLLIWILLTFLPWLQLDAREWQTSVPDLGLKYIGLLFGALLLGREFQWLQHACLRSHQLAVQPKQISGIRERGLMYAGLVVGLPYWWLIGVLVAKGLFLKQQPAEQATAIWASSLGSALTTLLVYDLLHRGLAG